MSNAAVPVRVVLVTGLSGAGKASVLRTLEDLGYETVDNPPLDMIEAMVRDECVRAEVEAVGQTGGAALGLAIGIDARSRGFDAGQVSAAVARLRSLAGVELELVYALADDATLLGRYTETRRRHPLAPRGRVVEGIEAERELTSPLRASADLVIDTSGLKLTELRQMVEAKFGQNVRMSLAVSVMSFAFPKGLPRDADMVFDARFLRNPHYDPTLRPRTGLDPEVASFVEADPDFEPFMKRLAELLQFLLPRFVREGKKYATVAIGCTGGRHRSVHVAESLAKLLSFLTAGGVGFSVSVSHRELGQNVGHKFPLVFVSQDDGFRDDGLGTAAIQSPLTGREDATGGTAQDCVRHGSPETKL